MHAYDELAAHGMEFSLAALNEACEKAVEGLQVSGATGVVKALQMVQHQKAVLAVGMFSMFEAMLQDGLKCTNGFREAIARLDAKGATLLRESFSDMQLAINVLKHGRGRSYDALVDKASSLPFRVKLPDEHFFSEGDLSEVATLIDVDDAFVRRCAAVIREVTVALG